MYRFQLQRKSTLFDYKIEHGRYCQDSLSVSKKGLVYPMVSKSFPCEQKLLTVVTAR
jgi:hypothetical protein